MIYNERKKITPSKVTVFISLIVGSITIYQFLKEDTKVTAFADFNDYELSPSVTELVNQLYYGLLSDEEKKLELNNKL